MKWRNRDIIDLEYFLHQDAVSQSAEDQHFLHERDRNIYLDAVSPAMKEGETADRRFLIRTWLDRRREQQAAADSVLPGEGIESLFSSCRILFILAGIVAGGSAALSFLTYTGERPLNVFTYLAVFVFSQVILVLLLIFLSMYRWRHGTFYSSSPLYRLIGRTLLRAELWIRKGIATKLGAHRHSRFEGALGLITSKGRTYGTLFFLPVIILTQLFGVGFNLGLLAATLFKIITADIAFGWQSTLQLSPEAVHDLVRTMAQPWTWLAPANIAYPSLAHIEGSRIILKEGIYHLATPDLTSWWPFLCFSVLFYGFLPRLLLFLGAVAAQHRLLAALDFRQGAYEMLLLRMTTPLVSTRGLQVDDAAAAAGEEQVSYDANGRPAPAMTGNGKTLLVMLPDDIFDACEPEKIDAAVQKRFGSPVAQLIRINRDYVSDMAILSDLKSGSLNGKTDILIIQEAWQPPIVEFIHFIRDLRQAVGHGPCIWLGLIGKPLPESIFTPVKDANREIWARKINAMGDPCISALGLVNHGS